MKEKLKLDEIPPARDISLTIFYIFGQAFENAHILKSPTGSILCIWHLTHPFTTGICCIAQDASET